MTCMSRLHLKWQITKGTSTTKKTNKNQGVDMEGGLHCQILKILTRVMRTPFATSFRQFSTHNIIIMNWSRAKKYIMRNCSRPKSKDVTKGYGRKTTMLSQKGHLLCCKRGQEYVKRNFVLLDFWLNFGLWLEFIF